MEQLSRERDQALLDQSLLLERLKAIESARNSQPASNLFMRFPHFSQVENQVNKFPKSSNSNFPIFSHNFRFFPVFILLSCATCPSCKILQNKKIRANFLQNDKKIPAILFSTVHFLHESFTVFIKFQVFKKMFLLFEKMKDQLFLHDSVVERKGWEGLAKRT